jgi:alpha-beta hydrolase superfamily lysophospholipase
VRLRFAVLAAALVAGAAFAGEVHAATFTVRDLTISGAGGTPLAATLYEPADAPPVGGFPAVVMFHGLGGTRASMDPLARQFFADQGYVVLAFDARGHGASGGLWGLDGPNENADARALYDFLAARPEVGADKIGAFGISLGGGAVWNSAVIGKVPWAAIAPEATWVDLYSALFPQNLPKSGVLAQLASLVPASRTDPEILSREQQAINGVDLPSLRGLTSARSVAGRLGGFTTPTLILQGRRDFLFDVAQARRAFAELAGPKRLYLGDFGHAPSDFATAPDFVATQLEVRTWFDRFLKGLPNAIDKQLRVKIAKSPFTGSAQFAAFPTPRKLVLRARGAAWLTATGRVQRAFALPRRRLETIGSPVVSTTVSGTKPFHHLVAVLSYTSGGSETIVSEGGIPLRPQAKPRQVSIRLLDQIVPIPAGARLRLTLAATSTAQNPANGLYLLGVRNGSRVRLGRISVTLPVLRKPISSP